MHLGSIFFLLNGWVVTDGLDGYAGSSWKPTTKRSKHRNLSGEFIRGPLPLRWFSLAAQLPGPALAVALAVWFRRGIERRDTVTLFPSALRKFGLSRWSGYRGLKTLEVAGLAVVKRHCGRSPVVTIRRVKYRTREKRCTPG